MGGRKGGDDRERDSGSQQGRTAEFLPIDAHNLVNIVARFSIDNLLNEHLNTYYVQDMNAEGQSQPGQPPAIIFPSEDRFGVT
jgi:hypothetical protein